MGSVLYTIVISFIPMVLAITVHEFAHAWTAKRYGDQTAFLQGRVTLDPLNHIDPIGTIVVPIASFILTGFVFGWARPVPVNFSNLRNVRSDGMKVALAGPISNFIMAILWSLVLAFSLALENSTQIESFENLTQIANAGIGINLIFMLFNLIPILPLDGGRVLQFALPYKYSRKMDFLEDYGMWIVFALAYLGVLSQIIRPIEQILRSLLIIPSALLLG